ncbi:MAG TPA: hypothetical protein VFA89_11435 [Terriglobales bacterium]|nr:hypothetical protein [Terriglobales bacterium]
MNNERNSPWVRAAMKRWPGYSVQSEHGGDGGPIALVNRSLHYVVLFALELFAQQALQDREARGDAGFCELHRLQPDYGAVRNTNGPLRVNADLMEREKQV